MLVVLVGGASLMSALRVPGRHSATGLLPFVTGPFEPAKRGNSWTLAAAKIKEDRGEPTGRQAAVEVPAQLKHYSDRRRFLGIQTAEWKEHDIATPRDFAGLAHLIADGELVEVASVTDDFILYGVGGLADEGPFTHFDKKNGKRVALYNADALAAEYARLAEAAARARAEIEALRNESKSLGKNERTRLARLKSQIATQEKSLKSFAERKELLDDYYGDEASRRELSAEYESIAAVAGRFEGREYKLDDTASRRELKVRMLSHLRPEALKVLEELARSYREKFDRPLPVTSLVRPDDYQRQLGKVNSNATQIETPPHSTGLAFDILYKYMTAEEQAHVMADIARLRDAGRVESLRENRDHFHVFAFIDGQRPSEELIRAALGENEKKAEKAEAKAEPREEKHAAAKKETKTAKAAAKKADKKQTAKKEPAKRRTRGGRA